MMLSLLPVQAAHGHGRASAAAVQIYLTPYCLNGGKCRHTACEKYDPNAGMCEIVFYDYDTDCDQPRSNE